MPAFTRKKLSTDNVGVGIDLLDRCNAKCVQCYYEKSKFTLRIISINQFKKIVKKIKNHFGELYLLGGEPTLHPDLPEILRIGLSEMETVVLVTNALKLADEYYCKEIALPGLAISAHRKAVLGKAKKTVDKLMQTPGAFNLSQKAWENIEKYWRGKVYVQINLLRPLVENGYVEETFRWAKMKGFIPLVELSKSSPCFERGNPLDISIEEAKKMFELLSLINDNSHIPLTPPYYGNYCMLIETSIHITVTGDIVPCVGNQTPAYGNIFQDDVEKIINHPLRTAIKDYKNWIAGPCKDCQYLDYCRGGCRGEARNITGCLRASDPYCWHHSPDKKIKDMVPASCKGCILEDFKGCYIKK